MHGSAQCPGGGKGCTSVRARRKGRDEKKGCTSVQGPEKKGCTNVQGPIAREPTYGAHRRLPGKPRMGLDRRGDLRRTAGMDARACSAPGEEGMHDRARPGGEGTHRRAGPGRLNCRSDTTTLRGCGATDSDPPATERRGPDGRLTADARDGRERALAAERARRRRVPERKGSEREEDAGAIGARRARLDPTRRGDPTGPPDGRSREGGGPYAGLGSRSWRQGPEPTRLHDCILRKESVASQQLRQRPSGAAGMESSPAEHQRREAAHQKREKGKRKSGKAESLGGKRATKPDSFWKGVRRGEGVNESTFLCVEKLV